jgi:hypothetical protein
VSVLDYSPQGWKKGGVSADVIREKAYWKMTREKYKRKGNMNKNGK